MQISRRILLACAVTTILLPNFTQAQDEDSEAQRKAREALERAMQALPAEPAPQAPAAPAVKAPEKKADKKAVAPAKKEPVFQSEKPVAPAAPVAPAKPVVTKPAEPAPAVSSDAQFQPVHQDPSSAAATEKAMETLNQRMKEIPEQPEHAEKAEKVEKKEKKEKVEKKPESEKPVVRTKEPTRFTPMQGPATGLPATKEERLKALLDDYKADKLTPEQYHTQRAKILSEP